MMLIIFAANYIFIVAVRADGGTVVVVDDKGIVSGVMHLLSLLVYRHMK